MNPTSNAATNLATAVPQYLPECYGTEVAIESLIQLLTTPNTVNGLLDGAMVYHQERIRQARIEMERHFTMLNRDVARANLPVAFYVMRQDKHKDGEIWTFGRWRLRKKYVKQEGVRQKQWFQDPRDLVSDPKHLAILEPLYARFLRLVGLQTLLSYSRDAIRPLLTLERYPSQN